jgi:hypothetical protein
VKIILNAAIIDNPDRRYLVGKYSEIDGRGKNDYVR